MKKTVMDYMPSIKQAGCGFSKIFPLSYNGSALTGATAGLDYASVPTASNTDRRGAAGKIVGLDVFVGAPGSGTASGSWVFTLKLNGVAVGTATIAYNASPLQESVDLRDGSGNGIAFHRDDLISIDLTTVPGGSLGGLTSMTARVHAVDLGVSG